MIYKSKLDLQHSLLLLIPDNRSASRSWKSWRLCRCGDA